MADRKFNEFTESGDQKNVWTNGFDLQSPDTIGAITWDGSTRTVSIAPASGQTEFSFFCNGVAYSKTTQQDCIIPDVTGMYYVYFDNSGAIQYVEHANVTSALFHEYAIVALARWNATQGSGGCGEERHGVRMSGSTHMMKHLTDGARYESGINITGLVDASPTYTGTTSGYFWDEDIRHTVDAQTTHGWMYRLGTSGEWTTLPADNKVAYNGGSGDTYWNEWTGTTWQLTRMTSSTDFSILFFAAVPSIDGKSTVKIMGHGAYPSRSAARDAIETEYTNLILEGLPSPEMVFLYSCIVRRNGDLENLSDGYTYFDLRKIRGGAGGVSMLALIAEDIDALESSSGGGGVIDYANPVSVTTTTSLDSTASGKHHVCSGTTADYTVSLPTTGMTAGDLISFEMSSALTKFVALDAGSSVTIDGEQTRVMWANEIAVLLWDGSNWCKTSGKSIPLLCEMYQDTETLVTDGGGTTTLINLNQSDSGVTGDASMADTTNKRIAIKRKGMYHVTGRVHYRNTNSLSIGCADIYLSGAWLVAADYYGPSNSDAFPTAATIKILDANEYLELFGRCYYGADTYSRADVKRTFLRVEEVLMW